MSGDLAAFLLARIAEDEARARAMTTGPSTWPDEVYVLTQDEVGGCVTVGPQYAPKAYLRVWNPSVEPPQVQFGWRAAGVQVWGPEVAARVLAECDAKRRIVDMHHSYESPNEDFPDVLCWHDGEYWPCPTVRLLALPYVDHPDFRAEWRP